MVYILEDRKIRVEWTILKGTSPVREDFRRALVKVFLIGNCEKYLLEATADRGTLMIDIPEGLEPGLYSLEAIWVKNAGHPGRHDRDLCRSMKQDLFAITEFEEEATNLPEGTVVLKAKSSTATYGYDGLSSYELAVLRGEWNGTEGEWLKHQRYVSVLDGRGDSEVDTMSQKSITEELVKHDTAIKDTNKEIDTAQTDIKNLNDEMDEVQDRLNYIPKESFLSSEPACDYHTEDNQDELTVSRAIKDRFGRIIDEHYVTRETVKDYTQEVVDGSKLEVQPGSVQPEDLSPAVQQMIESAAAQPGHITNLPDEEDLTVTEHNTLQFKDREYNPYNYSGMGKVYLRKHIVNGTNMLTQHMMNKPNTIYVIRYDYCLGGETIEVPEGCVLEFDGGSLRNGKVVLKKTYIQNAYKSFRDTLMILGSISNESISTIWWEMPVDNSYPQYKQMVCLCNNSNLPLNFTKGTYIFVNDGKDAPVMKNSVNFNDSVIILNDNGYEGFTLNFSNSTRINQDITKYKKDIVAAINKKDKNAEVWKNFKNSLLKIVCDSSEYEIRDLRRIEFEYIDEDGVAYNDFYNDEIDVDKVETIFTVPCINNLEIKNVRLKIISKFNGTASDYYVYYGLDIRNSSNVTIDKVRLEDPKILDYSCVYFAINTVYNLKLSDLNTPNTRDNNRESSYVVLANFVIRFHTENCIFGDAEENNSWGHFGTNYITDWYSNYCKVSRYDTHHRLNNLTVKNGFIGYYGIRYSGFGTILLENCDTSCAHLFNPRQDYWGYFDGVVTVKGCTFEREYNHTCMYCTTRAWTGYKTISRWRYLGARKLNIIDCDFLKRSPLFTPIVVDDYDASENCKYYYPEVYINNLKSSYGKDFNIRILIEAHAPQLFLNSDIYYNIHNSTVSTVYGVTNNILPRLSSYTFGNYTNEQYLATKEKQPRLHINFYNCEECTCESNVLNTIMNLFGCTITKHTSSLTKDSDGNFYAEDNEYNIISCIYKPMIRTLQNASACLGGRYFFSGCLLSCEEITLEYNAKDFYRVNNDNVQIGSRGKNCYITGCAFDKFTSDLLGLSVLDFYPAFNNREQNHASTYVYMSDDSPTLDLTDYIRKGIRTFRVNSSGNTEHSMIIPSSKDNSSYFLKLNLNLVNTPFKINMAGVEKDMWITNVYSNRTVYIYTDSTPSFYLMSGQMAAARTFSGMSELNYKRAYSGQNMWHSKMNKQIYKGSSDSWLDALGNKYDSIHIGTTSQRPATTEGEANTPIIKEGFFYFDTTLNKPIWWTGSHWVDATGSQV